MQARKCWTNVLRPAMGQGGLTRRIRHVRVQVRSMKFRDSGPLTRRFINCFIYTIRIQDATMVSIVTIAVTNVEMDSVDQQYFTNRTCETVQQPIAWRKPDRPTSCLSGTKTIQNWLWLCHRAAITTIVSHTLLAGDPPFWWLPKRYERWLQVLWTPNKYWKYQER